MMDFKQYRELEKNAWQLVAEKAGAYAAEVRRYFIPMAEKVGLSDQLWRAIRCIESTIS